MIIQRIGDTNEYEFNHDCANGQHLWVRTQFDTPEEAADAGRYYENLCDEDDYVAPPWLWALKQVVGAITYLGVLTAMGVIAWAVSVWLHVR